MDAKQTFNFLLNQIETSELNYAVTKTPFSASVSLKSTFAKRYQHSSVEKLRQFKTTDVSHFGTSVELDNIKLNKTIESLKITIAEQKDAIDKKCKEVKDVKKEESDQISQFRAELLKVKSERNKLQAELKSISDENNNLKEKSKLAQTEAKTDLKDLTNQLKTHHNKVNDLERQKKALEILNHNLKGQTNKNEPSSCHFKCELCDNESVDMSSLKDHIRAHHSKDQYSQSEMKHVNKTVDRQFSDYLCFYCSKRINSVKDLEKHRQICYQIKEFSAHPCEECGAQCPVESVLGRHRTLYHKLATFSKEMKVELYWCDVCPFNFRTYEEFEYHMKAFHEEFT